MTILLDGAIECLRELPDVLQDRAARHLMQYVDEVTNDADPELIIEGAAPTESGTMI